MQCWWKLALWKGRAGSRSLSKAFELVLHRSLLFLDKVCSKSTGQTGRGGSHSTDVLLMGVAEGQNSLSRREWRNTGKVSLGALTGTWVCCLLLPQRTLPQLEGSASLVADSLPELSWHSHSFPPLSPWAKRKEKKKGYREAAVHKCWSTGSGLLEERAEWAKKEREH